MGRWRATWLWVLSALLGQGHEDWLLVEGEKEAVGDREGDRSRAGEYKELDG